MSSLEISINHNLPQAEALRRVKSLLSKTSREHGDKINNLVESWSDNKGVFSFTAQGYEVSGSLVVEPHTVELKGKLPFVLSLFKGTITKTIEEKARELLQSPV